MIPSHCRACGAPLLIANLYVDDGCPCNSPRGVNFDPLPCAICSTDCVKPGHHLATLYPASPRPVHHSCNQAWEPGWTCASFHDPVARRGLWYREHRDKKHEPDCNAIPRIYCCRRFGRVVRIEVCAGREGDDAYVDLREGAVLDGQTLSWLEDAFARAAQMVGDAGIVDDEGQIVAWKPKNWVLRFEDGQLYAGVSETLRRVERFADAEHFAIDTAHRMQLTLERDHKVRTLPEVDGTEDESNESKNPGGSTPVE